MRPSPPSPSAARALLYIGHPGHELAVWQWVVSTRPRVFVITDGSGPDRSPRIERTGALLRDQGIDLLPGSGECRDRALFDRLLARDAEYFVGLAEALTDRLAGPEGPRTDVVVGDAYEGYNPTHDVCRLVVDAAVERARRVCGCAVLSYEVSLDGRARTSPPGSIRYDLDDVALAHKRELALATYPELARALLATGEERFRVEWLMPARPPRGLTWDQAVRPYYEEYGAKQVARGHYAELITFDRHIQPVARTLWEWATASVPGDR